MTLDISVSRLAAALAARCQQAAPPAIRCFSTRGGVVAAESARMGRRDVDIARIMENDRAFRTWDDRVEFASTRVLHFLQEVIGEALGDPWPVDDDGEMATPFARVESGRIEFGYESPAGAAVRFLRPIPIGEIVAD